MKRRLNENKGYSLAEMIIVIAIIAILTSIAVVTIGVMHSAKAKEASMTFESRLQDILIKSKGQMAVKKDGSKFIDSTTGEEITNYKYALRLYEKDDSIYLQNVICYGTDSQFTAANGYKFDSAMYSADECENTPADGTGLSTYVYVKYISPAGGTAVDVDADGNYIVFNKDGYCVTGYGTYEFYKKSSKSMIAEVTINKNGSIIVK